MKTKKYGIYLLVLVALLIPSNVFAAAGWQKVGEANIAVCSSCSVVTNSYTATDGGNFKLEISTHEHSSNSVGAIMYVNGVYRDTKGVAFSDGNGTIEFSGLAAGSKVRFELDVSYSDILNIKFYD